MRQVAQLPRQSAKGIRWGTNPVTELDQFLAELPFVPEKVVFWVENDLLATCQALSIENPMRCAVGDIQVTPDFAVKYVLGSSDGRSVDYLSLTCLFNREHVRTLFMRLSKVLALDYARDLRVFAQSESTSSHPAQLALGTPTP